MPFAIQSGRIHREHRPDIPQCHENVLFYAEYRTRALPGLGPEARAIRGGMGKREQIEDSPDGKWGTQRGIRNGARGIWNLKSQTQYTIL